MAQAYRIDRINLITYPKQKKRTLYSCRCRYLAKSHIVRCSAKEQKFEFVNFRGSTFKRVDFENATFTGCDFWGTKFNECNFAGAHISDSVFMACRFHKCDFSNCRFNYTTIVNTSVGECNNIDLSFGVRRYSQYPKCILSDALTSAIDSILSTDKNLRKCKLLSISDTKYNELNIYLLQKKFSKEKLPELLYKLEETSTSSITTYKKLERTLKYHYDML